MKPPFALVMVIFLWGQMVSMIFVRKNIHLSTSIFVSTILNHSIAECFISYESVMDPLEELLLALLLQLVGRIMFPVSRLLTISMSVRSSFLDDVLGIERRLIFSSSFMQQVPARATDDASVPVR